ncbi:MAG: hypothetical protein ACHQVK_03910, partial [Candidatus Paceibacterales bacterium]
ITLWRPFFCDWGNGLWQCCGFISAVGHIAGFCLKTGEKRVISHHSKVELFEETYIDGLGI